MVPTCGVWALTSLQRPNTQSTANDDQSLWCKFVQIKIKMPQKISLDFWFHQLQQKESLIISISGVLGGVTDSPDRPRREDEDAEQRVDGGRQEMVQALEVRL